MPVLLRRFCTYNNLPPRCERRRRLARERVAARRLRPILGGFPRFPIQGFLGPTSGFLFGNTGGFLFGSVRRFFANITCDRSLDGVRAFLGGIPRLYSNLA